MVGNQNSSFNTTSESKGGSTSFTDERTPDTHKTLLCLLQDVCILIINYDHIYVKQIWGNHSLQRLYLLANIGQSFTSKVVFLANPGQSFTSKHVFIGIGFHYPIKNFMVSREQSDMDNGTNLSTRFARKNIWVNNFFLLFKKT